MLDAGRHPNINILAYSEIAGVSGQAGSFTVQVRRKARYVKEDICNACGDCVAKCPGKAPDSFDMGLRNRKSIYLYFAQGIPAVMTIDAEHCRFFTKGKCRVCEKTCVKGAIDFDQQDEMVEIHAGAIILATGLDLYDAGRFPQYGYGRLPNVITGLEYERLINATGPTGGHLLRPSDQKPAEKVAYVQCVGSRDLNHCSYCSSVCCMYAIKDAMLAREHDPNSRSYIFHTDLRNVGKGFRNYERRGAEEYEIEYIRGRVAEIQEDEDHNPILWYEDTEKREVRNLQVDMAVLAVAATPSRGANALSELLGIEQNESGFLKVDGTAPVDTTVPGIFACGFALGPRDIPESVASASAAACRVAESLGYS
ncbi:MAG: CoB--CoM heterodisulfide reductase iron-sulfur subunit A family protein [Candidatus Eisenbacteria sp.]|nr:CoB--CoM heterodisulfide reductase iron-sulfur subunit A family protein [Candidatus Eisenbacteria bacterium]